ncbi:hypothetical protein C4577_07600 [Candidatus Parcubacteria bacterium]|nr:MAG: hypothetical protein C4577_07600 [Candidatus Parcubacteria bacterium]
MVRVRGMEGTALAIGEDGELQELGLTNTQGVVKIIPNYRHKDYRYDDFGSEIPPEVMWMLTDVTITMSLVHFDPVILKACIAESAGGGVDGLMEAAGKPLGAGKAMYANGNHFMTLFLSASDESDTDAEPWRFNACYLAQRPIIWPISAERSIVDCIWRAIPYVPLSTGEELKSSGVVIWDHSTE